MFAHTAPMNMPAVRQGEQGSPATLKYGTKKAAAFHNEAALSKIFVYDFNLCATGNHKTGGRIYV